MRRYPFSHTKVKREKVVAVDEKKVLQTGEKD